MEKDLLEVRTELQNVGCKSVGVGENHFVALLKNNTMIFWSLESKEYNPRVYDYFFEFKYLPWRYPNKSKVAAVCAGVYHSAALITNFEFEDYMW